MTDFLSRLVERTFGLMQVAEPVITPSFAAEPSSFMENMESSVFDINPGIRQDISQSGSPFLPRGITQPGAHPGCDAGIKDRTAITGTGAGNRSFEVKPAGPHVISGQEQSGFDSPLGNQSGKIEFSRDMTDVSQQSPQEATRKNEKTIYHTRPEPVVHEMPGDDEPGVADDIHAEHAENGGKIDYHTRPEPMIPETPVKDETGPEGTRAEIMAAEKNSVHQPERSPNIAGTPEDKVSGNIKNSYTKNMKSLKDTPGVLQVQQERITHEPQTDSADQGNIQKPGDKHQRMELGNQSEFQVEDLKPSKSGTLVLRQKETHTDKTPAKHGSDLARDSLPDRKIYQKYLTGESYISNQGSRKIQGSLTSTTITGTPVSRRELYRNTSVPVNRSPPLAKKHTAELESHSANPSIKVTIGHVEVRAATQPAMVSPPSRQNPVLSLNDYLKKRNGNIL